MRKWIAGWLGWAAEKLDQCASRLWPPYPDRLEEEERLGDG